MNREQLMALPAVMDVPTAASILGLSRTTAYELIRVGQWPTPVVRLGKQIRLPSGPILELLGVHPGAGARTATTATATTERQAG
jgi:predicted DNA-binding transcriptional regulator AlpA